MPTLPPIEIIERNVATALDEDVGSGDITAELIPEDKSVTAQLICKDEGILCGVSWAEEVFRQLATTVSISWRFTDGDAIARGDKLAILSGPARPI
ncbi:MAG: nicotinate-nucleotide diphosphorylase, partial [Proteobacteria bacterium]|nr:nicotinate-nucleotide diphosphorylase [Pseudomonadota bacterium]